MSLRSNRLWLTVIALGCLFDLLFWKQAPGINFAIFAALCLIGGLFILLSDGKRPDRTTLGLIPGFLVFTISTFVRSEPMTTFLSICFTLFVMAVMAMSYLGGQWLNFGVADYAKGFFQLSLSILSRPFIYSNQARKDRNESGTQRTSRRIWPILRGILLAVPILVLFAALLGSADLIFNQQMQDFMKLFKLERFPEYVFRLFYILVVAYALAGVILHAGLDSKNEKLLGVDKPLVQKFLGFTESAIILGSVAVLFSLFVFVQFQYFFGGKANINLEGYTYSEYARRGFGELVTVAFFSLVLILSLSTITRREDRLQQRVFSALGAVIVALVSVMLVSAYQRLALYEAAYGFSRLRTYTHIFLLWIGLLLAITVILEMVRRERAFALAAILAAFGFSISLTALNVDRFIVRQNIERELQNKGTASSVKDNVGLDVNYFLGLSNDAIPELVDAYQNQRLSDPVRVQLGGVLACLRFEHSFDQRGPSWQSFHFSRYFAAQALESIKSDLDEYQVKVEDWTTSVLTPQGSTISCTSYMID